MQLLGMTLHKTEIEFTRKLDKLQGLLRAFRVQDVQIANTIYTWIQMNGVSLDDFRDCVDAWTEIAGLRAKGYFSEDGSVKRAKRVREIERSIKNPVVRRYVRRARLALVEFSQPGG